MSVKKFDYGEFTIVDTALGSADLTFTISATTSNRKGQDVSGIAKFYEFPDLTLVNFAINISEKGGTRKETVGIASAADANNDQSDGRKRFLITVRLYDDASTKMRGVKQDNDGTNAIANFDSTLVTDNFPVGSLVKIVWDTGELSNLDNKFSSSTGEDTAILGETIAERKPVSASSVDNKIFNFDSTDSNLQYIGILKTGQGGDSGDTRTFTTTNGKATGFSGFTPGDKIYVDNGGSISGTKTTTSEFAGIATFDGNAIQMSTESETSIFNDSDFKVVNADKELTVDNSSKTAATTSTLKFQGGAQTITFPADSFTVADAADVVDFGTGADGALTITSGTTDIALDIVKNFTTITIDAGATLSTLGSNGILFLKCTGDVIINGTIDLNGKGAAGGVGVSGSGGFSDGNDGTNLDSTIVTIASGLTAGRGGNSSSLDATGGSGASSIGSGTASLSANLVAGASPGFGIGPNFGKDFLPIPGAGGASGGGRAGGGASFSSGTGGNGGGALYIACGGDLTITGTIDVSGTNAGISSGSGGFDVGGSSGGAGGSVFIVFEGTLSETTPTYTLIAGTSSTGAGNGPGTDGGFSSDGLVVITPRKII